MKKTTKMAVTLAAMSVMVLGAATMVSADEKNGWLKESGSWYYYVDDEKVANNWAKSGDDWYFLGDDGKMQTKKFINNDQKWVESRADIDDASRTDYYYVDADGKMVTGWVELAADDVKSPTAEKADNEWYFFDEVSGKMYGDAWVKGSSAWYYVDYDGTMLTNTRVNYDKKNYILDKNGAMITGWYKASGDIDGTSVKKDNWVWAKTSGEVKVTGWEKINSKWYFFGSTDAFNTGVEDYVMVSEVEITDGDETFLLSKNGDMVTGWYREDRDDAWKYYGSNGAKAVDKLVKVTSGASKYYLFDTKGEAIESGVYTTTKEIKDAQFADYTKSDKNYTTTRAAVTSGVIVYELGTARTGKGTKSN